MALRAVPKLARMNDRKCLARNIWERLGNPYCACGGMGTLLPCFARESHGFDPRRPGGGRRAARDPPGRVLQHLHRLRRLQHAAGIPRALGRGPAAGAGGGTARPCRVLEIGAGRSGFGKFLRDASRAGRNPPHLTGHHDGQRGPPARESSDEVITGNIDRLEGSWDLIFHSYVYEHLCRPREFNERLWSLLSPGGHLVIQCPRYDFPLYFPPCWDHLPLPAKLWQTLRLAANDLAAACGRGAGSRFTSLFGPGGISPAVRARPRCRAPGPQVRPALALRRAGESYASSAWCRATSRTGS